MDLAWHCRLIDRMIKNNPDTTIKHYYDIIDKEEENQMIQRNGAKIETAKLICLVEDESESIETPVLKVDHKTSYFKNGMKETTTGQARGIFLSSIKRKKKKYILYKKSLIE